MLVIEEMKREAMQGQLERIRRKVLEGQRIVPANMLSELIANLKYAA